MTALAPVPAPAAPAGPGGRSLVRALLRDRLARAGLAIVLLLVVAAAGAPVLAPRDPAAIDPAERLQGPGAGHLLGTDQLGRDLLSRLLHGARWSLGTAGLAAVLIMTIGVGLGLVSGYYGGALDAVLMRLVDTLLGFPRIVLALAIVGLLGPGILHLMLGLVAVWWVDYARIVRGLALSVREREYVEAARSLGAPGRYILLRHILPGVVPPVTVLASLEMGELILAISGLNFLGLGVQPPIPEWGAMLNDGRVFLLTRPHLMVFPGLLITLAVVGFNLLGDGLRDALDPRTPAPPARARPSRRGRWTRAGGAASPEDRRRRSPSTRRPRLPTARP